MSSHETLRFPMVFSQNGPQDGAKIDPRSCQDGSKIVLGCFFVHLDFSFQFLPVWGSVLVLFWAPKWAPGGEVKLGVSAPGGVQDGLGVVLVRYLFPLAVWVGFC